MVHSLLADHNRWNTSNCPHPVENHNKQNKIQMPVLCTSIQYELYVSVSQKCQHEKHAFTKFFVTSLIFIYYDNNKCNFKHWDTIIQLVFTTTRQMCKWWYLSQVEPGQLVWEDAECRHKGLGGVDAFEGDFLTHAIHHQLSVQGETWTRNQSIIH